MFIKLRATKGSDKGFTLVELLVVIIIIGILAAVAIPAFLNQRQRANDAAVQSDVKNIATQIESALVESPNTWVITTGSVAQTGKAFFYVGDLGAKRTAVLDNSNSTFGVQLSPGVVMRAYDGAIQGYIIRAYHTNGKRYTGNTSYLVYKSNEGGIQPSIENGFWNLP